MNDTRPHNDASGLVQQTVLAARADGVSLSVSGGGSKSVPGNLGGTANLEVAQHAGIVKYQPSELVITVRGGTPLAELDVVLAEQNQMLPCESPAFGDRATVGGTVAAAAAGPRRPYAGSVRDAVLGTRIVNGLGETLTFGGQVMKNVAGYDLSRLMVGSWGCLGVVLDVSLKVVPRPQRELTLCLEFPGAEAANAHIVSLLQRSLPVSASCYHEGQLWLRLSGSDSALTTFSTLIGGESGDPDFWRRLNNRELPFFDGSTPLWRITLPENVGDLSLPGEMLSEWHGCLRWYRGEAGWVQEQTRALGGFARCVRGSGDLRNSGLPGRSQVQGWEQRLKEAFDPEGLFNPGLSVGETADAC